ncbi:MAG: VanW family protein [Chloroflexi bacterium]|nr:VanW family protein [Chloroflexota bacterium]
MSVYPPAQRRGTNNLFQGNYAILSALVGGIGLFVIASITILLAFQFAYLNRIYPGVSIAGINLSGMSPTQAAIIISNQLTFDTSDLIFFQDGDTLYKYTPEQLGLIFDPSANADSAYLIGRQGWQWTRIFEQFYIFRNGIDLPPSLLFNGPLAQNELESLALRINQPVIEAALSIEGFDVQFLPGQVGRTLDVWATTAFLSAQFLTLETGVVPLIIHSSPPAVLDASAQAETAGRILSQPLTLISSVNGETVLEIDRAGLADMLEIQRVLDNGITSYQINLNRNQLLAALAGAAPQFNRAPNNARFVFNDETRMLDLIEPATIGQTLDLEASIEKINQQVAAGNHRIELVFNIIEPMITDSATTEELGISELLQSQTTYFYGSSSARIKNIQIAAAQFHGLFVPPGAVFSMVDNIGDISLDSGYAESLIIFGDRTIKGVGGGVCQVSTTLFRAVFFAGFPVVERYSHAYRVYYYELNRSGSQDARFAGLDATLYTPLVDFKFKNDTPYWLLMETYVDPSARSITWKFYSTSDGRQVEWQSSGLMNTAAPPTPIFEENSDLVKGEVKQVDWAVQGADVRITRTVTRNGELFFNDEFTTHYEPWAMVCQYGPKTKDYPPKIIDDDLTSCDV